MQKRKEKVKSETRPIREEGAGVLLSQAVSGRE